MITLDDALDLAMLLGGEPIPDDFWLGQVKSGPQRTVFEAMPFMTKACIMTQSSMHVNADTLRPISTHWWVKENPETSVS